MASVRKIYNPYDGKFWKYRVRIGNEYIETTKALDLEKIKKDIEKIQED